MHALLATTAEGVARRLRVALVIDRFDGGGGAAIYTRDFAAWLVRHGVDVHVIAREAGSRERHMPLVFHQVSPRAGSEDFVAAVQERLAVIRPDVSHDMGAARGCDVLQPHVGSSIACQRGAELAYPGWYRPLRRLMQSCSRRRGLARFTQRQFAAAESLVVAVSRRVAADVAAIHGVPERRIRVVHNGVDVARFAARRHRESAAAIRSRLGFRPDDVVVIAVAHNPRLKGLHVLERVIRGLRRDGLPLRLMACGGSRRGRADDAVVWEGSVADVAAHYAAADIAAQPTFYDACSLATLEALASGLPVITTRLNGASELITPGVDGVVIDTPRDEAPLAESIAMLATDRWRRATMGRHARRLAAAHDCDDSFRGMAAVYAEVLATRGIVLGWHDHGGGVGRPRRLLAA